MKKSHLYLYIKYHEIIFRQNPDYPEANQRRGHEMPSLFFGDGNRYMPQMRTHLQGSSEFSVVDLY